MGKHRKNRLVSITGPSSDDRIQLPERASIPFTEQRIIFSIECCSDKCCFRKIKEYRDKADFADRLHELSQITWGQAKQTGSKSFGYETLDHITIDRSSWPPGARTIGFVYHDNHRMWGYRTQEGIFHVTGFDYDGKQYKHGSKH